MIRGLSLSSTQAAGLERAARASRPLEYCAALLGDVDGELAVVTDLVRLRNCDTRPGRFAVADAELRHAELVARERRRVLVALLHSHALAPAVPSARDLAAMAGSRWPWVILGFDPADRVELAAFDAGTATPIPIVAAPA